MTRAHNIQEPDSHYGKENSQGATDSGVLTDFSFMPDRLSNVNQSKPGHQRRVVQNLIEVNGK